MNSSDYIMAFLFLMLLGIVVSELSSIFVLLKKIKKNLAELEEKFCKEKRKFTIQRYKNNNK